MLAEIAVGFAILAALVFVVRHFIREAKGQGESCCCCSEKSSCKTKDSSSCGKSSKP